MKLDKIKFIITLLCAVGLMVAIIGVGLNNEPMMIAGVCLMIISVFVKYGFQRCPHCNKPVGRKSSMYCKYCGKKIN